MPLSTVSGILTRIGMGRLGRLGLEPAARYERERPGELVDIDVKKLGRIQGGAGHRMTGRRHYNPRPFAGDGKRRCTVGWDYVHIAIDDCTRLAYAEVLPDEKASSAIAFLRRAVAFYRRHGITVERVMTDNGSRLPRRDPRHRLQDHRHPPPPHPPSPTTDQRKGRAVHPHHARQLGLRRALRHKPRAHRSP